MIKIKDFEIRTDFGFEFTNISFTIEDTIEDLSVYSFDLYRGSAVNDEFNLVYSNIQNFECNDFSANLLNDEIMYYYKIKITNILTDEFTFSDIMPSYKIKCDNYAYYLTEVYNKYLEDVIGNEEILLLKRKRTGELCECFDDIRGPRNSDKCEKCFGTGYVGGFYPPMIMRVNYLNTESIQEEMDIKGTFKSDGPRQFWTCNYPIIQEGDIVLDTLTNARYTVQSWQPSRKNGFLIRQVIQITRLPESSIFNKVTI